MIKSNFNTLRRSICAATSVIMCLGMMSFSVFAASTDGNAETEARISAQNEAYADLTEESEAESAVLDKDNLADGTYTAQVQLVKTDRKTASMANNAIDHTVTITVENGEYYATLDFDGMSINLFGTDYFGYLSKLYYFNAGYTYENGYPFGDTTAAEVVTTQKNADGTNVIDEFNDADNPYPDLVKIKLVDKASEEYVPLQVFVPIMESIIEGNGTQKVLMKVDWTTLKASESDTVLFGDASCDGVVDILDATAIQKHIAAVSTLAADNEKAADVNGDGAIDITDVTLVQKFAARIISTFPVEE